MVEHKSTALYKHLISLKHRPKTDLAAGFINNSDAIVLLFHLVPQFGAKLLRDFSQDWRGLTKVLDQYFGPHNGYTATDFSSGKYFCPGGYGPASGAPRRPPFWYRQGGAPYTNALTADGFKRLQILLHELSVIGIQV